MKPSRIIVALLALAVALTQFDPATAQQYYYQPAPDYYHNDTAEGTFMGGLFGALTGAAVSGRKNRGENALIGAGIGALTGNLLGRSKDRADASHAAYGQAVTAQANQQAAAAAVTNYDLLEMTRAGLGDDVIISALRSRGARLDLSPSALITLKQNGVSDRVLVAAQELPQGPAVLFGAPPVTVVREVAPPVIVAPGPWGPYYRRPYYPRPGLHIHYRERF